ncbi:hypothetical protein PTKIN_Ptkin17bG0024100 [Pterospermum kingtungense]
MSLQIGFFEGSPWVVVGWQPSPWFGAGSDSSNGSNGSWVMDMIEGDKKSSDFDSSSTLPPPYTPLPMQQGFDRSRRQEEISNSVEHCTVPVVNTQQHFENERARVLMEDKIIVVHHGYWDQCVYKNGEEDLLFISLGRISFRALLEEVHEIVYADLRTCRYVLHCLIPNEDNRLVKSRIRNDLDLKRVSRIFKTPNIYVTVEPRIHDVRQDRFIPSMASQGAYGNPFSYGSQIPWGSHILTGDGMSYMHCCAPYLSAPYIYGFPTGYGINFMHRSVPY